MKTNTILMALSALAALTLLGCSNSSNSDVAGSGSNTGNAFIVGVAKMPSTEDSTQFEQYKSVAPVRVALIESDDTSGSTVQFKELAEDGSFSFSVKQQKRYTIQIDDTLHGMGSINFEIVTREDTTTVENCVLTPYGTVQLQASNMITDGSRLLVPGTVIRHRVQADPQRTGEINLYLPQFPAGFYNGLFLENDSTTPTKVTAGFTVLSSDTTSVTSLAPTTDEVPLSEGIPPTGVKTLSSGGKNGLLVGTDDGTIGVYDSISGWKYSNIRDFGVFSSIRSLAKDNSNTVWCGTEDGVLHIDNSSVEQFHTGNSQLPGNTVTAIATGINGDIWFSTEEGGIACKSDSGWKTFSPVNSYFPDYEVYDAEADSDYLWAITPKGIAQYSFNEYNNRWFVFNQFNSPFSNDTMTALVVDDSTHWFGAIDGAVYSYENETWKRFDSRNSSLTENTITALFKDSEGTLWVGNTNGELFAYNNNSWITFNPDNSSLPMNCGSITSFVEVGAEIILVATENAGVVQLSSN